MYPVIDRLCGGGDDISDNRPVNIRQSAKCQDLVFGVVVRLWVLIGLFTFGRIISF